MGRVIDRMRNGKRLENRFRRCFLMDILTQFEREYRHRKKMVAAAQAAVAARVVASGTLARYAGNASVGDIAGVRRRTRYQK